MQVLPGHGHFLVISGEPSFGNTTGAIRRYCPYFRPIVLHLCDWPNRECSIARWGEFSGVGQQQSARERDRKLTLMSSGEEMASPAEGFQKEGEAS